jgi:hypothetical protein
MSTKPLGDMRNDLNPRILDLNKSEKYIPTIPSPKGYSQPSSRPKPQQRQTLSRKQLSKEPIEVKNTRMSSPESEADSPHINKGLEDPSSRPHWIYYDERESSFKYDPPSRESFPIEAGSLADMFS